jgi:prepilin-type N-terminal cleavage/methylation domain-containing protein
VNRAAHAAARGFTLLEVMVAMAIMAFLMAAITSSQGSSLLYGARVFNLTTATQLADSVILDIEEEYRLDGFPDTTREGQDCKLPRGFQRFDCEYDLFALDIGSDNVSSASEDAGSVMDSPLVSTLCGGGAGGNDVTGDPLSALAQNQNMQGAQGALAALLNPQYAELCGMNVQKMCQNIPFLEGMIPEIIKQAAETTRRLVVHITWDERGNARKALELETFITAAPQAEDEQGAARAQTVAAPGDAV